MPQITVSYKDDSLVHWEKAKDRDQSLALIVGRRRRRGRGFRIGRQIRRRIAAGIVRMGGGRVIISSNNVGEVNAEEGPVFRLIWR